MSKLYLSTEPGKDGIDLTWLIELMPVIIQLLPVLLQLCGNCPDNAPLIRRMTVAALKELEKGTDDDGVKPK